MAGTGLAAFEIETGQGDEEVIKNFALAAAAVGGRAATARPLRAAGRLWAATAMERTLAGPGGGAARGRAGLASADAVSRAERGHFG